jgi:HEAT repeat protein
MLKMANGIAHIAAIASRPLSRLGFRLALLAAAIACSLACGCRLLEEGDGKLPGRSWEPPAGRLRSAPPDVILASLETVEADSTLPLPPEVAELKDHSNSKVRAAALRTLARRGHPQALQYARQALSDHDPQVVLAAIAAMGQLPTAESREILEHLLADSPNPLLRGAAVAALGKLRAEEPVLAAASDQSWRVRLEAARQLGAWSDAAAAAVAEKLLQDPSPEVQRAVISAVAQWPIESSGPILLAAMSSSSPALVKAAAELLAARWPPAAAFPADAPPQHRAEVLAALRARFREAFPAHARGDRLPQRSQRDGHQPLSEQGLGQIEAALDRADIEALRGCGPELLDAAEYLQLYRGRLLPESLYSAVLPELAPEFAVLAELSRAEVPRRRQAAQRLAAMAKQKPLRPLATQRLAEVVQAEQDVLVWGAALDAIENDASPAAVRLAYAGLSHPLPEVRRRACQYLAAHPDPRHAPLLLPALDDRSHSVVVAAIRALGKLGRVEDTSALRRLSSSANEEIRLEAAIALVRLGDPAGPAALERLSYSEDPLVLARVAQVMGEHPDPSYIEPLVRMLDGRPNVRRAALESLPKVAGRDVAQQSGPPAHTTEQAQRWRQWYQRQQELHR